MKNILHIIIINYAKYYWPLKIFAIIFHIFLIPVIQIMGGTRAIEHRSEKQTKKYKLKSNFSLKHQYAYRI